MLNSKKQDLRIEQRVASSSTQTRHFLTLIFWSAPITIYILMWRFTDYQDNDVLFWHFFLLSLSVLFSIKVFKIDPHIDLMQISERQLKFKHELAPKEQQDSLHE
ncbi:MAG: hypothetical protein PSN36_02570 [Gammaproteobacteria bacterium]|nr:hypothetical protein [Gammaproteobacteria bacterium]